MIPRPRLSLTSHPARGGRRHALTPAALALVMLAGFPVAACAQGAPGVAAAPPPPNLLVRRYHEGDTLVYRMEATNQGRRRLLRYQAVATAVVRKDSAGRFIEDFVWSSLVRDDSAVALPATGAAVRQRLTLAPEIAVPVDIAKADPRLIGPMLDLLTFYVDTWLAAKMPGLVHPGDHVRFPGNGSNSWADGRVLVLGEDAIDFDITLDSVDAARHVARVTVRHVPPAQMRVRLPADWMREPVAETPNNWVEVTNAGGGSWVASVGRETFDVVLSVSLTDGRILSATMDNPVEVKERVCSDAALTQCGEPARYRILRRIAVR
jgi:hypothetical protein